MCVYIYIQTQTPQGSQLEVKNKEKKFKKRREQQNDEKSETQQQRIMLIIDVNNMQKSSRMTTKWNKKF